MTIDQAECLMVLTGGRLVGGIVACSAQLAGLPNNALNTNVAASLGLQIEASPDDQACVRAGILHTYCRHRQGIHPQPSSLF